MNRQTKRQMARYGGDRPTRAPERRPGAQQQARSERAGPRQFLGEVRGELKKVAWPTPAEVRNSSIIVLITVAVMTTLIFGFDYFSAKFVLFLFD